MGGTALAPTFFPPEQVEGAGKPGLATTLPVGGNTFRPKRVPAAPTLRVGAGRSRSQDGAKGEVGGDAAHIEHQHRLIITNDGAEHPGRPQSSP